MKSTIIHSKAIPEISDSLIEKGYTPIDMHFHSHYSLDSIAKLDNVIKKAKRVGLGLAVTDHNEFRGSYQACTSSIPTIPGIEVTSNEGVHTLFYFYDRKELKHFFNTELKKTMVKNPFFADISVEEIMEKSENYNCIIGAPHPFVPGTTGLKKIKVTKYMEKQISVVEAMNGYNLSHLNCKSETWANEIDKPISAGSDGHSVIELGSCVTYLKGSNTEEYLSSLLKGDSVVVGKEENIFMKILLGLEKEEKYISNAHKNNDALKLVKSQFMTELKYYQKNFEKKGKKLLDYYHPHHFENI